MKVWRQAAGRVGAYLVFVQDTTTGVFADQRNGWVVFGKPDIIGGVHHDAVGIAIAGRGRDFLNRVGGGIKLANFVREVFGEPDLAVVIDGDIPRENAGRWHGDLLECSGGRVQHADGIGHGHGEPEIALGIKGQEQWRRVA